MAKKSKAPEIDFAVLQFYDLVDGLLSDAGRYAGCYKLRENLNDSATRFKVAHVFQKYYDSDMRRLNDYIHYRRRQCFKAITEINRVLERCNVRMTHDREALTDLLIDENRRDGWKKIIKGFRNENRIVSLQEIEMTYRRSIKAP